MKNTEWKIATNVINGKKKYAVYHVINSNEADHSGNREYCTSWLDSREQAEELAVNISQCNG